MVKRTKILSVMGAALPGPHTPMNPYKNRRSRSLLPAASAINLVLLFLDKVQIQPVVVSYSDYTKVKAASQAKQNN